MYPKWHQYCNNYNIDYCIDYNIIVSPQVTHSQRLKMNFEESTTVKSHFNCLSSSLLGFWVVWELFRGFFYFLPLGQKLRRDDNRQLKYDLTVLFSSIFIFTLWVTCGFPMYSIHKGPAIHRVYYVSVGLCTFDFLLNCAPHASLSTSAGRFRFRWNVSGSTWTTSLSSPTSRVIHLADF